MNAIPIKTWNNFQSTVANLSNEAPSRKVLEVILFWIRENYKNLKSEPFSIYGFDSLAKLNDKDIPVEYSSFKKSDLVNFKTVILKRKAKDVESIARFLRDTVEELGAIEVDDQCSKCKSEGMRVFANKHNGVLAYQCNVCGCSHYLDGSRVSSGELEFASERQLREFGLI